MANLVAGQKGCWPRPRRTPSLLGVPSPTPVLALRALNRSHQPLGACGELHRRIQFYGELVQHATSRPCVEPLQQCQHSVGLTGDEHAEAESNDTAGNARFDVNGRR